MPIPNPNTRRNSQATEPEEKKENVEIESQELPSQPDQAENEGVADASTQKPTKSESDSDPDPELQAKRKKATLKSKLAAGNEVVTNKAANIVAHSEDIQRLQCLSIFVFAAAISLAFALHVYLLNDAVGAPPTLNAHQAASWLLSLLLFNACLSTSGFLIVHLKLSHLVVGFLVLTSSLSYLFEQEHCTGTRLELTLQLAYCDALQYLTTLTLLEYYTTIVISKAAVTIHKVTFEDVKVYSKLHYQQYHLIPEYVAHYEINGNCCGWGDPDKKYEAWPALLETNDLPDTCCINQFYGCGRAAIPRLVPSGHMMILSSAEYSTLLTKHNDDVDTDFWKNDSSTLARILRHFPAKDGIPGELLRLVDQLKDEPRYYYLGEVTEGGGTIVYLYRSFGQLENYRLPGHIKQATCNTDIILHDTKTHCLFVLIYASIQLLLSFMISIVFWYYFIENRAEVLAAEPLSGDFTTLEMERVCLDDRYESIIKERLRLEKIKELRKQGEEKVQKRKELLEAVVALGKEATEAEALIALDSDAEETDEI